MNSLPDEAKASIMNKKLKEKSLRRKIETLGRLEDFHLDKADMYSSQIDRVGNELFKLINNIK